MKMNKVVLFVVWAIVLFMLLFGIGYTLPLQVGITDGNDPEIQIAFVGAVIGAMLIVLLQYAFEISEKLSQLLKPSENPEKPETETDNK